ncbi:MAG: DUF5706 domain-containing protein [Omnitrophica bacterium]|nr:DUF5706 domain-containing protein [Candidatus Omnitrophota bacterium]
MDDKLKYIFSNINDWLKFAEAKNAALLVFDTAILVGLVSIVSTNNGLHQYVQYYLYFCMFFIVSSIILSLLSFIPKLKMPFLYQSQRHFSQDNVLFFGHIAKYGIKEYLELLYSQNNAKYDKKDLFQENLAGQIIINSRIALLKYKLFEIGVWLTIIGITSPIIAGLIFRIKTYWR